VHAARRYVGVEWRELDAADNRDLAAGAMVRIDGVRHDA
jgi:hypothetical protein